MKKPLISERLRAQVALIHEQTHSKKSDAYTLCEQVLDLARELHDDAAFITIAMDYALVIDQRGYSEHSVNILYEALQLAQSYRLLQEEARLLNLIGRAVYTRADYKKAMLIWAQALDVAAMAKDDVTWVWAKLGLAQIYDAMEDFQTAVILLEQATSRANELNDKVLILNVNLNLGVNLFRIKRYDDALNAYSVALPLAEALGFNDDVGEVFFRIAEVHFNRGDRLQADSFLDRAEEVCRITNHIWGLANIFGLRALCAAKDHDFTLAYAHLNQGITYAKCCASLHTELRLSQMQMSIAEQEGNDSICLRSLQRSLQIYDAIFPERQKRELSGLEDLAGLRPSSGQMLLNLSNQAQQLDAELMSLIHLICAQSNGILGVPRTNFWMFEQQQQQFNLMLMVSQADLTNACSAITVTEHPGFCQAILKGDTIVAHTVKSHHLTWALYTQHQCQHKVSSVLIVPILVNHAVCGFLEFAHFDVQHNWTSIEIQNANQIGLIFARGLGNAELNTYAKKVEALNIELMHANSELERRVEKRSQELNSAMAHLVQTEKMVALGSLVAGFAHELNTPLGNTLIATTTMQERNAHFQRCLKEPSISRSQLNNYIEETTQLLELMERNARRASDLISNLKQIAVDTASDKPRLFELDKLVKDTIDLTMPTLRRQSIRIHFDIDSDLNMLSFPGALEQVLTNLMNNSLVHAFEGRTSGLVIISARSAPNQSTVELSFEDDGVGIHPDIQDHIFEPFFTTKFGQGGSGLGLYLVYALVVGTLRGEIKVEQSDLGGAKFSLVLAKSLSEAGG